MHIVCDYYVISYTSSQVVTGVTCMCSLKEVGICAVDAYTKMGILGAYTSKVYVQQKQGVLMLCMTQVKGAHVFL